MITINNIQFKDSYNEVSLKDYYAIKHILSSSNYDDFEKELKVLALLAGSDDHEMFDKWKVTDIRGLFNAQEFLYEEPIAELQEYYTLDGIKYKLVKQFNDLEAWQFEDLMNILKDKDGTANRLHELCTLFLRKVAPLSRKKLQKNILIDKLLDSKRHKTLVEKWKMTYEEPDLVEYSGELSKETAENIYNHLSFADANAISVFFCLLSTELSKTALQFLETDQSNKFQSALKMLNEQAKTNPEVKEIVNQLDLLKHSVGS